MIATGPSSLIQFCTKRFKSLSVYCTGFETEFRDQKFDDAFFWSTKRCTIVLTISTTVSTAGLALMPLWRFTNMNSLQHPQECEC